MEIKFLVKGSSEEPYEVSFLHDEGKLYIFCTCQAGLNGTHCKHRISIIMGDLTAVISENADDFAIVEQWLADTEHRTLIHEMSELESAIQNQQKSLKALKKKLARRMYNP